MRGQGSVLDEIFSRFPETRTVMKGRVLTDLWANPRPLSRKWGSGTLFDRLAEKFGRPDVAFGKQDQIPEDVDTVDSDPTVDPTHLCDWADMPFPDGRFEFGYWDPPYLATLDKDDGVHYKRLDPCYREIARVCSKRLAILHPLLYPKPKGFHRIAVLAITYGPNKVIRCLQVFERDEPPGRQETLSVE